MNALWKACGEELEKFTPTEFKNYLNNSGYHYK